MLLLIALACTSPTPSDTGTHAADPIPARFATFNVSLYRNASGQLISDLADPALEQGQFIANIVAEVQPDVLLLNELDYDAAGEALALLQTNFLHDQYPFTYVAPSNTGVHSGFDLDNSGVVEATPGSDAYGGDAFGFGEYEGQYAFAVLSRFPIASIRSFQTFLWRDLPNAQLPQDWYDAEELDVMRLSSKNHVDLSIEIEGTDVHVLVSHPTPPTFDGAEDRNGLRNHDEIAFWSQYIDATDAAWLVDDAGQPGGLQAEHFVIAGDLNADPHDGDSTNNPMALLLDHPSVQAAPVPASQGGTEQSELQGAANIDHIGDPAHDTSDFSDSQVGNLRLDYVLPSNTLPITDSGVFWPMADEPGFPWVGTFPFPASDHRLVWVDVQVPQ
jgi:hypothetical protein